RASGTRPSAGAPAASRTARFATRARSPSHPLVEIRHLLDAHHNADVTGGSPMIEARELRKTYAGGVEAVRGIDFDVPAGQVFGLLGPNGARKSTTIGMLATTIAPSGGTARVGGFDLVRVPLAAQRVSGV